MKISLDTECTGVDLAHGSMPFLVTSCDEDDIVRFWEWDVDPMTRKPEIPDEDLANIAELIEAADQIYLHNSKFDARALDNIGLELPWPKVRDTLTMRHLLASNARRNLTDTVMDNLGLDIQPLEDAIEGICKIARGIAKMRYPEWRIAEEGMPELPSVTGSSDRDEDKPWKNDMWLPRALIKAKCPQYMPEAWKTACSEYANGDSQVTLMVGLHMEQLIKDRGWWDIYMHRLELPRLAYEMESYGTSVIGTFTEQTISEYERHSCESGEALRAIAEEYGHDLQLAAGASLNDNMRDFFYGGISQLCPVCGFTRRVKHWNGETVDQQPTCPKCGKGTRKKAPKTVALQAAYHKNLNLPVIAGKKTGNASLDKDVMAEYRQTLEGKPFDFITILTNKRKRDTDLTYMHAYRRFWVPIKGQPGFFRLHPSLNPFGTDHLRWASNSPNLQNVGKQEDECEDCDGVGCYQCGGTGKGRISVRRCFGPSPDREWWSMDFRSIERRIPPYECGEPKMVEVFEKPDSPPYWGSLYYLTASVLYPDEFWPLAEHSIDSPQGFKKKYPRLYKQAKFFDLAKQYGCGRRKGDLLSRVRDSFDRVDNEFPLLAALQLKYLRQAEKIGYVETLPDITIDPKRGYPVLASRTEDGRVLSTTPFNYHVSGTACLAKNTALLRCSNQCAQWRAEGFDARQVLEIHDEIIFDFPRGRSIETNKPRAMVLRALMEQSGANLIPAIPTPVSVEYHTVSWAEGVAC